MGKRIIILGNGGTGKSTLGEILSRNLDIPVTHLDQITVTSDWKARPFDDFEQDMKTAMSADAWIVEGWSHHRTLQLRMEASDTIIHLAYPIWFAYLSALKRHIAYTFKPNPYDPPNGRIWKKTRLMIRAMWLVYRKYEPEFRVMLPEFSNDRYVYVFASRRKLNRWLRQNNWNFA